MARVRGSSSKPEEDGAFARRMSDGSVRTLHAGKGNYKGLAFDETGRQLAFVSDQADTTRRCRRIGSTIGRSATQPRASLRQARRADAAGPRRQRSV